MNMQQIYKNALRKARNLIFEDESGKYKNIILFCKYKLNHGAFKRIEESTYWTREAGSPEIETAVHLEELPSGSFKEYKKSFTEAKKTKYINKFIYN